MKKKIWVISPVSYILLGILLLLTAISYFGWLSKWGFIWLAIGCTLISAALILANVLVFQNYLRQSVAMARKNSDQNLETFPIPAVAVGEKGDILCFNPLFASQVAGSSEIYGWDILPYLSGNALEELLTAPVEVTCGNRHFTVYASCDREDTRCVYTLFYIENTAYKDLVAEYRDSRPVVALIVFDNQEELSQIAKPGEMSQISAEMEMCLDKLVSSTSGFLRKLNSERYLIVMEERHLTDLIEKKFSVMSRIHEIRIGDRLNVTISMGIGHEGKNLRESFERARQALDMALGRGGDQVAIKSNDGYSFFGGNSKGVEKRSRVRTRIVANAMAGLFENAQRVYIMGHRNSDLDSVGAAIGMWSLVTKAFQKQAFVVVDPSTTLAQPLLSHVQKSTAAKVFASPAEALQMPREKSVLVIVDTHSRDMLESQELYNVCDEIVVIDHHRKMVNYIDRTVVFYHEPFASSASEMVTELIEYLADNRLEQYEADALLAGMMLDTKNFVLKTGVRTFEAAAFLRKKGADTVSVKGLFADSFDTYKTKYQIVSQAEIHDNMAISAVEEPRDNMRLASAQAADELLSIQGVDVSFVLFPAGNGVSISARSYGKVNVQVIMEKLGGGGHLTMAGALIREVSMAEAKDRLLKAIAEYRAQQIVDLPAQEEG